MMLMTIGVLALGEGLVDILSAEDGTVRELPGGSPLNLAVGLGRLGHDVTLATWIGQDARGRRLAEHLAACGVRLLPGSSGAGRTSSATVSHQPSGGEAAYVFEVEWRCPGLPPGLRPGWVHAGSIAAVLAPGGAEVLAAVRRLRPHCLVSFDPNLRPAIIGDAEQVRPLIEAYVDLADVVKVSAEDLRWLCPGVPVDRVAHDWRRRGPALLVVTDGAKGARAWTAAGELTRPAIPVEVADTVGAGDAFMAGLLHGLVESGFAGACRRDALSRLSLEDSARALEIASRVAALTVARPGADPPWLEELG